MSVHHWMQEPVDIRRVLAGMAWVLVVVVVLF
jgi:hypothetical protein